MDLMCKMEFVSTLEEEPRTVATYGVCVENAETVLNYDDEGKVYRNYKTDFPGISIKCTYFAPLADINYMIVEPEKLKLGEQ